MSRLARYALIVLLLLIMLAQMVLAAPQQSAAFDEGYTLSYGYGYLRGGDARLSRGQNPPLTNIFLALPVLLKDHVVFPDKAWTEGDIFSFTDESVVEDQRRSGGAAHSTGASARDGAGVDLGVRHLRFHALLV